MDFLGNQTGVAKKIKNNNMIRLIPTRIESGRGKYDIFPDARLEIKFRKGLLDARVREVVAILFFRFSRDI